VTNAVGKKPEIPTLTHRLAVLHDTLDSSVRTAPAGFGVDWIVQLDPSQPSAKVTDPSDPTAVHAEGALHETPDNPTDDPPAGLGVDWIVQPVPSQTSADVTCEPTALLKPVPTAVHVEAVLHETPVKPLAVVSGGLGVGWIVQLVPSQRSAKVTPLLAEKPSESPTAVQALGDVHDTLLRSTVACGTLAVDWIVQLVPSHTSAKAPPTATHAEAVLHETL
jgi:hypothetical protein